MEAARRLSRLKSGALTANLQRAEGAWSITLYSEPLYSICNVYLGMVLAQLALPGI